MFDSRSLDPLRCKQLEKEIEENLAELKIMSSECKQLQGSNLASVETAGVGTMEVSVKAVRGLEAGDAIHILCSVGEEEFKATGEAGVDGTVEFEQQFTFQPGSYAASAKIVVTRVKEEGEEEKLDEIEVPLGTAKGGLEAWFAEGKETKDAAPAPESSGVEDEEVDDDEEAEVEVKKVDYAAHVVANFAASEALEAKYRFDGLTYRQRDLMVKLQVRLTDYKVARAEKNKIMEEVNKVARYEATLVGSVEKKAKHIYATFPFATTKNLGLFAGAVLTFHNFGDLFRI
jgi:hypothetical protein